MIFAQFSFSCAQELLLRNLTQRIFEMSGRRSFFASKKKPTDDRGPSRSSNPFDSDSDDGGREQRPARASSVPPPADQRGSLFGGGDGFSASSAAARSRYRNDFRDAGGLEAQSVQELEGYAAYKAEETTQRVQGCVRIAEEMRDTASKSLVAIHQQGQQITRTHMMTLDIDQDLSRSEKLLGDLGGIFSKKWKPKKNGEIRGPMLTRDDSFIRKGSHLEQRHKLGLSDHPPQSNARRFYSEPPSALQKVEIEKAKQDDGLSDLSNILTELKGMAVDMGTEIDRQTKALGDSEKDYDELNFRIKGANTRARRLLGK
uniref:t-SNARE coiled-coil homology domain-containing protein n=1 Tax=Oryza punctata TaxID=4537 RepID=A0A0E0JZE4_ORYPU